MRAAIYARYSTDLQSASSIEDQIRLCRERVEKENGSIVEIYSDYAISGSSVRNRPGMRALLEEAKLGKFDHVIAEALDRVSRDQEDIAAIYKRLRHCDIRLLTIAEGEISELHVGLKGTMNALFLKDLALKIRRGQRGRVEAGRIPGGSSYGYRIVRQLLPNGSVSTGERQIDLSQAAIVQRIFKEYADGMVPRQIAARLNREGVPSPRGGQWNASTINGNRRRRIGILNNELYLGRILYNRQRFLKDPETGKRIARPNPEHEWVTKEIPELRIIDDGFWERVQARKQRYSSRWGNKRQSRRRLFSGLLKCGCCGGGMTISRGDRYYCSARREKSTCKADRGIGAAELEQRVLNGLRDILLGNEQLIDEFTAEFQRELARLRK
jgi:DNA invertase Pin-like site-specific DNA recombinase